MSALKTISEPPGTLFRGKVPVGDEEVYIEAFIQKENIVISIAKNKLAYSKRLLIDYTLAQIVEAAMRQLVQGAQENDTDVQANDELKGNSGEITIDEEASKQV